MPENLDRYAIEAAQPTHGRLKTVELDGLEIASELDLHRAFETQLEFGDSYGRNLAALRDRLSTDVPRPVRVVWTDSEHSRRRLGETLFNDVCEILADVADQDRRFDWTDRFEFDLR